ncbi:hypothetical protein CBR_g4876 [Chara braunii]|uniref:Protein FAM221A n=1 Tax=Chara braunii TaxID=69332 RepID=A0A388KJ71_CHABU|nr:hypothetical protein CBR_g4876 [Chara braunii]|eukprot:GBG70048.1 hypothetical protein CBR_g4876 [Chara braunii]
MATSPPMQTVDGKLEASCKDVNEPSSSSPALQKQKQGRKFCTSVTWTCRQCQKQCVSVLAESRCMCGHRFKDHGKNNVLPVAPRKSSAPQHTISGKGNIVGGGGGGGGGSQSSPAPSMPPLPGASASIASSSAASASTGSEPSPPPVLKCSVAKCQCPSFFFIVGQGAWILRCRCKHKHTEHDPVSHACRRPKCQCARFDSPWVCNCDHSWSEHHQEIGIKPMANVWELMGIVSELNDIDSIKRGEDLPVRST